LTLTPLLRASPPPPPSPFFPRAPLYSYGCNSSDLFITIADFAASPGTYNFLSSIAFDIMTSLRDVLPADGEHPMNETCSLFFF